MARTLLVALGLGGVLCACNAPNHNPFSAPPPAPATPCTGALVTVLNHASAPPANVAADVSVTDCGGHPLAPMIDESNFDLAEDGNVLSAFEAQRSIKLVTRGTSEFTLLALDLSGSVQRGGYKTTMLAGARQLLHELAPTRKIAVYGFDGRQDMVRYADFTTDIAVLDKAITQAGSDPLVDDSTNLYGAVMSSLSALDAAVNAAGKSQVAHGSLVMFTDGTDHAARVPQDQALKALASEPYSAYAIGVGGEIDHSVLEQIGRTQTTIAQTVDDILPAFEAVSKAIQAEATHDFLVSYCSPSRAGAHTLEIRLHAGAGAGVGRVEFSADGFTGGCSPDNSPLH